MLVTASLLPVEVYELVHRVTPFKVVAFIVNVAVVVYLLYAKRLFGVRGGAAAEEARASTTSAGRRWSEPRRRVCRAWSVRLMWCRRGCSGPPATVMRGSAT